MRPMSKIAALLVGGLIALPAAAQSNELSGGEAQRMAIADAPAQGAQEALTLTVNKTYMLEFDADIVDIIVANPDIANVTARDRRRVAIMGMQQGESNIVFLGRGGAKLMVLDVSVTTGVAGTDQLAKLIKRYVPDANVEIEVVNGRIILAGMVPNIAANDRVLRLAQQYTTRPEDVLNMLTIQGKDQVALKVRIVEMQRSVIKQLGVNLAGSIGFGAIEGGDWQNVFEFATTNGFNVAGSALGGLAASIDDVNVSQGLAQSSIASSISALERVGLLRTLAEPNLTAISGESAQFLAGGEFPVPVAQDEGAIGIEFKPFGVGLGFTPVVLSEGRISLQISTEVSELTQQGAFQSRSVAGVDPSTGQASIGQTISVPALKVRRAETTVEMPSGGSLVIAGLIQEQTRQSLDGIPGAKDLPVLGALFRSRDFQNDETELVVIVTPYLVDPTDPQRIREPDDGYVTPRDAKTIFFGRLNEVYAVPGAAVDNSTTPSGASGFIFD